MTEPAVVGDRERFTILMGLEGSSDVEHGGKQTRLDFGQTLLLPAAIGPCEIAPRGEATCLDVCGSMIERARHQSSRLRDEHDREIGPSRMTPGECCARRSLDSRSAFPDPALPRTAARRGDPPGVRSQKADHRGAGPGPAPAGLVAAGPARSVTRGHDARPCSRRPSCNRVSSEPGLVVVGHRVGPSCPAFRAIPAAGDPLFALVDPGSGWATDAARPCELIWLFVVWGICGGAIARIAIVQVAALRQTSVIEALRFAATNAGPLIMAPLCPLFGVAFCAVDRRGRSGCFTGCRRSGPRLPESV